MVFLHLQDGFPQWQGRAKKMLNLRFIYLSKNNVKIELNNIFVNFFQSKTSFTNCCVSDSALHKCCFNDYDVCL